MAAAAGTWAKSEATYYTPQRIETARVNLERHAWAQALFERILAGDGFKYYIGPEYGPAATYAEQSDESMWLLQPTTKIARSMEHEARAICPVHGTAVRDINPWCPYNIDPINHPYKIQCMLGGEWYPSNDYAAGDMTSGDFPDDGNGCTIDGRTYYFLREYAHMAYGSAVIPALRSLSQAWVLTGDARYGRKGTILLARLASEYPNHDDRTDRLFYAPFPDGRDPHYRWKTGGMITDLIWETFCLEGAVYAYDGLFSYMDQDPEMLAFLREKGLPAETADELRAYIEHYLLKAGMTGLLNGAIHGNEGHHQASALACALVLDDYDGPSPNSVDMVDYTYFGAGQAAHLLVNGLTRDGGGHESPSYNRIKLDLIRVDQAMTSIRQRVPSRFPADRYPDLFGEPKARQIFDWFIDITMADHFLPSIGDTGGITELQRQSRRMYSILDTQNLFAFRKYGDPRHARAATRPDGTPFDGELFEPYPAEQIEAALQRSASRIDRGSRLMDGYGMAILASGAGDHERSVLLNYASLLGHRQSDHLSLGLVARGVDWLPDLGYPLSWDYRWQWDSNSMAHNTVTVDETQPRHDFGGQAHLFARAGGVHVIAARHDPYPEDRVEPAREGAAPTRLYDRLVALIDVDEKRFYVVDLFVVDGGEQHDQSWHGPLVAVEPPPLDWKAQEGGTLAGEDVPQFGEWTDRWGRERNDFPGFLKDVRRATLDEPAAWTWRSDLPEADGLRLHLVPVDGPLEVIGGRGRSPARPEDWGLDYVLARRTVNSGEASRFVSVLDAWQGDPVVDGVRLVSGDPLVVAIDHAGGTDRIELQLPAEGGTTPASAGLRLQRTQSGRATKDVQIGSVGDESGYDAARVVDVDWEQNRIAIEHVPTPSFAVGRTIRVFNDARVALYEIAAQQQDGDRLWLDLGDSALLGRGPIEAVDSARVSLASHLTFARRRPVEEGVPLPGPDYYAGSWFESGDQIVQIAAAQQRGDDGNTIWLREPISGDEGLRGHLARIWQYGIGDRVEAPRITVDDPR